MTFDLKWILSLTIIGILSACTGQVAERVLLTATPTASFTPLPTSTASPTLSPTSTRTPTASPTNTPTFTLTPSSTVAPTPTPSNTPSPTPIPLTPTPTNTATPAIDFHIVSWRLWPLALNSGCAKGMHTIFITVLDANGVPLNDVVVGDTWDNVEVITGSKGAGKAEIDLWSNTMEIVVKQDATTGQPYSSEVSFPFSSFMTTIPNEQMIQAGYCANEADCEWKRQHESYYCGGHYSWEVVFQKTY